MALDSPLGKLPPELWLIIFRLATRAEDSDSTGSYEPFQGCFDLGSAEALTTKRSLVQVCRTWRALASVFLYEDVRVRHDAYALRGFLESELFSAEEALDTPGRWVRRLELPYTQTGTRTPNSLNNALHILKSCPFLQTLVRPFLRGVSDALRYEFPADIVSLSSLTRLDWWHYDEAARSGGINSLIHVLRDTPGLQYLTLGGEFWASALSAQVPELPALTTLRFRRVNAVFIWQVCRWMLPSLVHVIVDFPPENEAIQQLWLTFGEQLRTIEFGRNVAFHLTDQLGLLLRSWPSSVKVLNYFIHFTMFPQSPIESQAPVENIGIHSFPCAMMSDVWEHLDSHFIWLATSPSLTALKHVILYGQWENIIGDYRFVTFQRRLEEKGCQIELAGE
ncbi:hypothetical protein SCLCIDRAFT_523537 [Scleroderma citrinum Foug A]|uniref:F-box domain-containing protein n=1 Tax=Scleroderma citrinum Foug A TaxID=1036808 RepID=A0A0C3ER65_9AGAM|nr:hypothetical protein SCLCIDRAFT_523537 [Scleroderma citrinum Foug A]